MTGVEKKKRLQVPRLRFPEFKNNEPSFPLSAVAEFVKDKVRINHNSSFQYVSTESLLVDFGGMRNGGKMPSLDWVTGFCPGDILISNIRPYLKKVWRSNIYGGASNDIIVLRATKRVAASYLAAQICSDLFIDYVMRGAKGVKMPRGEVSSIKRFPVWCPSSAEQKKIADCLSSLDELIVAEVQKLNALKFFKNGLMSKIFPPDGVMRVLLRFPDFIGVDGFGEREVSYYIESLDAGVSVNSGDRAALEGEIGVLKTSCVTGCDFDPKENKVVQDEQEISRVSEPVRADTIIISRMNTVALVGESAFVGKDMPNLFLPDRLWSAKSTGKGDMRFLAYFMASKRGRSALAGLASGTSGSMKNIAKSHVLALKIDLPSLAEQRKIADFISSLDEKISAQSQRIDCLRKHKTGLLQQLFPVLDEEGAP